MGFTKRRKSKAHNKYQSSLCMIKTQTRNLWKQKQLQMGILDVRSALGSLLFVLLLAGIYRRATQGRAKPTITRNVWDKIGKLIESYTKEQKIFILNENSDNILIDKNSLSFSTETDSKKSRGNLSIRSISTSLSDTNMTPLQKRTPRKAYTSLKTAKLTLNQTISLNRNNYQKCR